MNEDKEKTTLKDQWIYDTAQHVVMLLPNSSDVRNIMMDSYNLDHNETLGATSAHLRQYTLSRQSCTGSWLITKYWVQLISATPQHQIVEDHGLLSNNFRSFDLYGVSLAEYDWRYRSSKHAPSAVLNNSAKYSANIKSDSTFLASMVWSRLTAVDGPETWADNSTAGVYGDKGWPELRYNVHVEKEIAATTIRPESGIAFVLAINPLFLLATLAIRTLVWPRSPVGEGFGLISLLASVEQRSLALLGGAGFSGDLQQRVFVGFQASRKTASVTTVLATRRRRIEKLSKDILYY